MKALLIIDMQNGSFTNVTPRYRKHQVIENINALSDYFRINNDIVVFVQHDGTATGDFKPGTEDWDILPELKQGQSDFYISKTANDCFYRSGLEELLEAKGVREIVVTGCATDFCVDTTIKSALTKDYGITVIEDGHTTTDRDPINAKELIGHYNWIWQHMLPTGGSLLVCLSHTYLSGNEQGFDQA